MILPAPLFWVEKRQEPGTAIDARFNGNLDPQQEEAVEKLAQHEIGGTPAGVTRRRQFVVDYDVETAGAAEDDKKKAKKK